MFTRVASKACRILPIVLILGLILATQPTAVVSAVEAGIPNNPQSTLSTTAADHLVTEIVLTPHTPNVLEFNQNVNLSFNYQTSEPGGVRIFARPFSNGALTPNYAAHGSGVYPGGSGSGTGFFTITSGAVTVDQIRIQMLNADQTVLLFEAFIPVHYQFRDPAHIITEIALTPPNPNVLEFNQNLNLSFNYKTSQPGGVRIFARPFTNGALTPNYAAHGSGLYPSGSGSGTGFFTITSGEVTVDHIRIQMVNADQTLLLFETFIPVHYQFKDPTQLVYEIVLNPPAPNILDHNQNVNLSFKYKTSEPGGVRIFARPFTAGAPSPNYAAHGSGLYPGGSGSGTGFFTISSGPVIVDHIRIQMVNADQTLLLFETLIPVHYQYGKVYRLYMPVIHKAGS